MCVCVGSIKKLRVLGYADDAVLMEKGTRTMTERLTTFADECRIRADMKVKLAKTFSQIVQQQDAVDTATTSEMHQVTRAKI